MFNMFHDLSCDNWIRFFNSSQGGSSYFDEGGWGEGDGRGGTKRRAKARASRGIYWGSNYLDLLPQTY